MKFELKRITYNARLSQETPAFAADVWIDGQKVGQASNEGHGGSTSVHLHLLSGSARKAVDRWVEAQPATTFYPGGEHHDIPLPVTLDSIVDDLLEKWLDEKYGEAAQKKKWCKNAVVFRLKGDKPGTYRTVKKDNGRYTRRLKDWMVKTYGDKIDEIVNEALAEMPV